MSELLRVDTDRFASETLDGETIVMDTVAGRLTLLTGLGPAIWDRLVAGANPETICREAAERFGSRQAAEVVAFLASLREQGLVELATGVADYGGDDWPETYATPSIETYDDIADIMTMDPIHDVEASRGWPRTGPG